MFIYWILFAVLAAGALLNQDQGPVRARLPFLLFACIPTALMIGFRWKIGPDWSGYLDQFNYTKLYSFSQCITHEDPGYFTLYWIIHQFDGPFYVVNIVCGCVLSIGLTAFCRRQPNPWLAFLTALPYLVIVVGMSGNRQSLALGFLFLALNAFADRKILTFSLLIFVAALFHGSVILMFPICMLSYSRNNLQRVGLLLIAGLLGAYFFQQTFNTYAERYSLESIQSNGVYYRLAMNGLAALLFLAFRRRFEVDDYVGSLWRNVSLCTILLGLLLPVIPSSTAVDRFLLYFFPLQFFVLSRLPRSLTTEPAASGQITLAVIIYDALVQSVFLLFGTFATYYVPYRSIFNS